MNSMPYHQTVGRAVRAAMLVCPALLCSVAVVEAKASFTKSNNTEPTSINDKGVVTGFYTDANDAYHGFIRTP